jgi:hypothetical protein
MAGAVVFVGLLCVDIVVGGPGSHEWRRGAEAKSRSSWINPALLAKDEASQLIAQLLDLLGIAGGAETFGQLEKCFFFLLLGFDSLLDEFHQHAVIAESALFGQSLDLSGDLGWQGEAMKDMKNRPLPVAG